MAGYSSTPLVKKLGIKPGYKIYVRNCPVDYVKLIGSLPEQCKLMKRATNNLDMVHVFCLSVSELTQSLTTAKKAIKKDGMIWVSWPKKSSAIISEVTENVIRQVCLPMDLVDIKVCAIDETWSGLKLVIRKSSR